jgi:hypothetical protein
MARAIGFARTQRCGSAGLRPPAAIEFLESDRPDAPRAGDAYRDEGVASASTGGPLLGHERAGRPLDRLDDRYRGMGGARTTAAAKPTSSAFAGPSSADVRPTPLGGAQSTRPPGRAQGETSS